VHLVACHASRSFDNSPNRAHGRALCWHVHIALDYFSANQDVGCHITTGQGDVRDYTVHTDGNGHYSGDQSFYYGYHDAVTANCGGHSDTKDPWW